MDAETRTSQIVDYLNGRLSDDDRAQVEALIQQDRETRDELEFLRFAHETLASSATAPAVPPAGAFDALMARIRVDEARRPAPDTLTPFPVPQRPPSDQTLSRRGWSAAFAWLFRPSLSYAVAASVFVAQFALLAVVYQRSTTDDAEYSELRTKPTVAPVAGPFIRASLKPEATESEIRFLLISLGATIVGGPTQLGDYFIYVPPERADWAAQQMRQSPITDQVNVIATLPPLKD